MNPSVYKVLVLGTGFGRRVQLPVFAEHPRFTVVGVASGRAERAKETAREFGIARYDGDWRRLLEDVPADVVSVVTPVDLHLEPALATLASGRHLLIEKPLAMDAAQAQRILEAARDARGCAAVNHEFRYRPDVQTLHRGLRKGTWGDVRGVETRSFFRGWADPESRTWGWLSERSRGGGFLGAIGSHNVDYVRFLTGREVLHSEGDAWTLVPTRRDSSGEPRPVTADDSVSMRLTLDGGIRARIDISGATWWDEQTIRVFCDRATVTLGDGGALRVTTPEETREIAPDPEDAWNGPYPDERRPLFHRLLDRFARRCDGEQVDDLATLEEGVGVMRILDSVRGAGA